MEMQIFEEIEGYKGTARWFTRANHFYVASRVRGATTTMRCAFKNCEVRWILRNAIAGVIKGHHNHEETPWVLNRNKMFQELKHRCTSSTEHQSNATIYGEVAARYPDAVPHLQYENVLPSMRSWRKTTQPADDSWRDEVLGENRREQTEEKEPKGTEKKRKKKSKGIYEIVKRNCIALVKIHGRPVELFDDEPFKNIIKLLPLTETQRASLSSKSIKLMMEGTDDTTESNISDVNDDEDVSKADEINIGALKAEKHKCTCSYNNSESDQHELDCAIVLHQPFWRFFDVSVDTAVCNICNVELKWTDISTLQTHLQAAHPNVRYKDDDDEKSDTIYEASSAHSAPDMEEVYLENFDDDLPLRPSSTRKKRKLDDVPVSGGGPLKSSIQETVEMSLMKYKSLDRFGLYIGSLLKMLPAEKCAKFQVQIVQRLLQEQAAAG